MAKIGIDAKLFIGEAGTTPSDEYKFVREVGVSLERSEIDATTRAADGWEVMLPGLKKATLEFEIVPGPNDDVYAGLKTAFLGGGSKAIFVSDGDGNGLDADWVFVEFTEDQKNDEVILTKVKARPTMDTRAPAWKSGDGSGGTGGTD